LSSQLTFLSFLFLLSYYLLFLFRLFLRWHSDGPRFDCEAIDDQHTSRQLSPKISPKSGFYYSPTSGERKPFFPGNNQENNNEEHGLIEDTRWEELRDNREMLDYHMSIAADPTSRKNLIPGAISASKLRYLSLELFGDLVPTSFGTFDFYMTVLLYLFAFWMRIYVHYLAQYLFILVCSSFLFVLLWFSSFFLFLLCRLKIPLFIVLIFIYYLFSLSILLHHFPLVLKLVQLLLVQLRIFVYFS
jgi:hypothetical protein